MFMYQVFIIYLSQSNIYHIFKGTKLQVHTGILGIHISVPQYFHQLMALNHNTCSVLKLPYDPTLHGVLIEIYLTSVLSFTAI